MHAENVKTEGRRGVEWGRVGGGVGKINMQ